MARTSREVAWIHSARTDIALALAWLPFGIVGLSVSGDGLRWFAAGVLLLSLAHQPVTLGLVYADSEQFGSRRRLFVWTPVVLATAVFIGLTISFFLVAIIGALWNTEHTLMQRYGLTRIYRRKGGETGSGRLDLMLLSSWLRLVLAWAVADSRTPGRIESLGLGSANRRGLDLLVDLRPFATVLLVVAIGFAGIATARWLGRERANGFAANPATYLYVGATASLFGLAIVHPVAGLLAWVGSHAIEYFVVVITSLDARRRRSAEARSILERGIRAPAGVIGFVGLCTAVGVGTVLLLQVRTGLMVYGMVFFCVGGMHIFYDGVIWKLRTPRVAETFAIDT